MSQQTFRTPDSESHPIQLNTMNVFHSEDVGTIATSKAGIACQGQSHKIGGYIIRDIVKISQFQVIVKEEDLLAKGPRVEVTNNQARLPPGCSLQGGGCLLDQKTVIWNPPTARCNLELVRTVDMVPDRGYLIDHERTVLLKKEPQVSAPPECGQATLWATDHESIFLTQDAGD